MLQNTELRTPVLTPADVSASALSEEQPVPESEVMQASTTERLDSLPGCGYSLWQDSKEFCFTTDAVFLAAFPYLVKEARVLELGSGTGAISLLLAARGAKKVTGVDVNQHVVELMQKSIADNHLTGKIEALTADIRDLKQFFASESFDLVIANPPYRNSGKKRQVGQAACHEITGQLEDFFRTAAYMVKYRGRFALVQLPERFTEAMALAAKYNLELKKLQWVHSFVHKSAWIFLAEFVKGGAPGLEVLPPLVMYKADGTHSEQTLQYYQMTKEE